MDLLGSQSCAGCWMRRQPIFLLISRQVVIEHGPFAELLLDNFTAFRSAAVEQFVKEWDISLRFRAAYAPSGNGIVERNNRTTKRIAVRGDISPELATFGTMLRHGKMSMNHLFQVQFCLGALGGFLIRLHGNLQLPRRVYRLSQWCWGVGWTCCSTQLGE